MFIVLLLPYVLFLKCFYDQFYHYIYVYTKTMIFFYVFFFLWVKGNFFFMQLKNIW